MGLKKKSSCLIFYDQYDFLLLVWSTIPAVNSRMQAIIVGTSKWYKAILLTMFTGISYLHTIPDSRQGE